MHNPTFIALCRTFGRPVLVLAILCLAGCGGGLRTADPAEVGMDGQKLAQIDDGMAGYVEEGAVSGAVTLVAKDGRIVHHGAVGLADIESGQAMTGDTIFRIASMTKPITATALMILVDEGKVSLDDPVSRYIPEFAQAKTADAAVSRPVTLRDCLTHTAGLGGAQIFTGSLEDNARELAGRTLVFQPGTRWQYSPGLNVAGA